MAHKPCVYYHVLTEVMITKKFGHKHHQFWAKAFDEALGVDFQIVDPSQPDETITVYGSFHRVVKANAICSGDFSNARPEKMFLLGDGAMPVDFPLVAAPNHFHL